MLEIMPRMSALFLDAERKEFRERDMRGERLNNVTSLSVLCHREVMVMRAANQT